MGGSASSVYNPAVWSCPLGGRIHREQLLKVLSPMSHLPVCVQYEATICCSDSTHLRSRLGVEFLQSSIGRSEVISIMMLYILSETPDIPLLVSSQESSSPT